MSVCSEVWDWLLKGLAHCRYSVEIHMHPAPRQKEVWRNLRAGYLHNACQLPGNRARLFESCALPVLYVAGIEHLKKGSSKMVYCKVPLVFEKWRNLVELHFSARTCCHPSLSSLRITGIFAVRAACCQKSSSLLMYRHSSSAVH